MSKTRRIYRLSPSQLSAETIAVTFAKTSRSPESFDVIASELDEEKSSKFSEKWIVGYGHASVAEHAVLHLALENVSRLAIETIEGNRLASYTEKSTRYQEWDSDAFVIPEEMHGTELEKLYQETVRNLFETYAYALPYLRKWAEAKFPINQGESQKAWQNRTRVIAIDVCRFILPAASMANVGVTMNARALEYAIKKMLSSQLAEVRAIGQEVKQVATQELPTLVKYATPIDNLDQIQTVYAGAANQTNNAIKKPWIQLLHFDPEGELKVLAALLFRFGMQGYQSCLDQVHKLSEKERQHLVGQLFMNAGDFDVPLRELEYTSYKFEALMDQGAYFEFKRHRMMSQTAQPLTATLGFSLPRAISEAGVEDVFVRAMRNAAQTYQQIVKEIPPVASYVVPNAFNRRVLFELNLRELFHFSKLRCNENAHFSIRRVGRAMLELIAEHHPLFLPYICVRADESSEQITSEYFSSVNMD